MTTNIKQTIKDDVDQYFKTNIELDLDMAVMLHEILSEASIKHYEALDYLTDDEDIEYSSNLLYASQKIKDELEEFLEPAFGFDTMFDSILNPYEKDTDFDGKLH